MTRAGPPALAILAALMVSLPATAPALQGTNDAPDAPEPIHDPAWAHTTHDALAWSTQHKHALVSPLVTGAATLGAGPAAIEAYHDGIAWADARLASADQAALARALDTLLTQAGAPAAPANLDQVPNAYVAPLTVLLEAQQQLSRDGIGVSTVMVEDPWANTRAALEDGAWLLGAIERVIPALEKAAPEAPSAPVALDVLGLVILGGEGDDVYERNVTGPYNWKGPILLIEPQGEDVYKVPVASRANMWINAPTVGRVSSPVDLGALAIEMEGNDTYERKAAHGIGIGRPHVLVEQKGNDTYGSLSSSRNVASANGGLAFLADREGNDTYRVKERGIAYAASLGLISLDAIAILGDWQGNDTYEGLVDDPGNHRTDGQTHAYAENAGAVAVLRDYSGNDTYTSDQMAYASSINDALTFLWDDAGNDSYWTDTLADTEFGRKTVAGPSVRTAPTAHSLASFTDGGGQDTYDWDVHCCEAHTPKNNHVNLTTSSGERWGVFIDCESASNATIPCEEEQHEVLATIVETECDRRIRHVPVDAVHAPGHAGCARSGEELGSLLQATS